MVSFYRIAKTIGIAAFLLAAMPVFAEPAPVYDADNLPAQFAGEPDHGSGEVSVPNVAQERKPPLPSKSSLLLTPEQRLNRIEQQVTNLQNGDSASRLESLQHEVQSLRGQVEALTHQIQQLQAQQRSQYSDLDKRLTQQQRAPATVKENITASQKQAANKTKLPSAASVATEPAEDPDEMALPASPQVAKQDTPAKTETTKTEAVTSEEKPSSQQPDVAEEQQIYQTAYSLIKEKKYNDAIDALQKMLTKYPSGQFAANAHYWLGELYGLLGRNEQSLIEFNAVVRDYPDSPRISDAQLKLGLIYAAQFQWNEAKLAFRKTINRYPGSASSRLAAEQLKQIKQAGH